MLGQIVTYGRNGHYNIVSNQGVCWAFIAGLVELVIFPNRFLKVFEWTQDFLVSGKVVQVQLGEVRRNSHNYKR